MSATDLFARASAAYRAERAADARKKHVRKQIRRYTPNLPITGPVVYKFYHYPPGEWVFVAARNKAEVRRHPLYDSREYVSLATLRDLNAIAADLIKTLRGEMLTRPPERMRSHTRGHQAVRHSK
jgi:hypothetical protein